MHASICSSGSCNKWIEVLKLSPAAKFTCKTQSTLVILNTKINLGTTERANCDLATVWVSRATYTQLASFLRSGTTWWTSISTSTKLSSINRISWGKKRCGSTTIKRRKKAQTKIKATRATMMRKLRRVCSQTHKWRSLQHKNQFKFKLTGLSQSDRVNWRANWQ